LILTGQHPDLDPNQFGLGELALLRLDCPGRPQPDRHVDDVFAATVKALRQRPNLLIVQGDTSSAYGACLAGVAAGVAVAHVEAGLRSHDLTEPWPEEGCRRSIDRQAELLFAPTDLAAANLRREEVSGAIHVTGNSGIDALLEIAGRLPPKRPRQDGFHILVTIHRRENWNDGLHQVAAALTQLAAHPETRIDVMLHPNPQLAGAIATLVGHLPRTSLHPPCTHRELICRMRESDLVLSDSGGMQEEAPALGTPLLILRNTTERPEGIATGNLRLVGCRTAAIVSAVEDLRSDPATLTAMAQPALPYGDGRASERIAAIVDGWVAERSQSPRQAI
jgi:UDP-N-acetylglucosamine 2-epimerase (non-hydrolysing)